MGKQRIYPILLLLGAGILLFRTVRLLAVEGGWETLALWVIACTVIEMLIDLFCIAFSLSWLLGSNLKAKKIALRLGAAAAIFHAFRVLIYVLGRIGSLSNFDLKPQFLDAQKVEMFWVCFASVLSVLGVIGVLAIWRITKKGKRD